jgi:hypothetical protein
MHSGLAGVDWYQGYLTTRTQMVKGEAHWDLAHPVEDSESPWHAARDSVNPFTHRYCKFGKLEIES